MPGLKKRLDRIERFVEPSKKGLVIILDDDFNTNEAIDTAMSEMQGSGLIVLLPRKRPPEESS